MTLAANAVLNNFLLVSAFFLDGLANAAEQLCGSAYGGRDTRRFPARCGWCSSWGFGFALAVDRGLRAVRPVADHIMTASAEVQHIAQDYLWFVVLAPLLAVFAFTYDGIFVGATWAREMRNLMLLSLADLSRCMARAAPIRQRRAMGSDAGALCRARRVAGAALSRQSARFIPQGSGS